MNNQLASINPEDEKAYVTLDAGMNSVKTNKKMANNLNSQLAIDLDATAHPTPTSRLFWDQNKLVSHEHSTTNTNCSYLLDGFSLQTKNSFKQTVLQYREDGQIGVGTLIAMICVMRTCAKTHPTSKIDVNWVAKNLENKSFRKARRQMRLFLQYWRERYVPAQEIVSLDALNLLAQVAVPSFKSDNVNSDDPEKSWLTDEEYDGLLQITWSHYDATGDQQTALIRLLSLQYARRPCQLQRLKFSDLRSCAEKDIAERSENEINFPSVKEKFVEKEFRGGKFETHPIAGHLWSILKIQRKKIQECFEKIIHQKLTVKQVQLLPVFTTSNRIQRACKILKDTLYLDPISNLDDELFHLRDNSIGGTISFRRDLTIYSQSNRKPIKVPVLPLSVRTGHPIKVNAIRLRHTRIRQLARQSVPRVILSHWLGHTTDEALNSYYSDPAEEARRIDAQLAPMLTPIAQAFTGIIITTDAESTFPHESLKRLELAKEGQLHYLGRCGKFSFCATNSIPIPCYRCRNFEPLADAPHEEVLNVLKYRQAQENTLFIKSGSMRNLLVPIDLSDDIRAVERCIALCKAKREEQ